ncbi:UDP-glycosyltransferase 73C3-like [Phalaenopsis equestris]|uniref:UDP-glycosyltransferase 73C3-like n=1 Tax=Phalaenopsis equestris TaxID=78828 RepID=UPI0009E1FAA7|nr:UDP-glycosyltransferase 73C3-like [Phalaenopsis equestris]
MSTMNGLMKCHEQTSHFVVVPLMAQGHMIPMADLALLLAHRGARVSLITTPVNACRLRAAADHAAFTGLLLRLVELPFPCKAAGLPDGCENIDLIQKPDLFGPFFKSLHLMAGPLKNYLRAQPKSPTCIISDQCMPWTMEVSKDLNIPRFVFHGPSCFFHLCTLKLVQHKLYENVKDDRESFTVPELPQRIEVNKLTAQRFFDWPQMEDLLRRVEEADDTSDGFVLNSFQELEPWYIDEYRRSVGKEVWPVGPVSLLHKETGSKAVRGNGSTGIDQVSVLQWLEGRERGSVIFISFGSIAKTRLLQLVEIGFGLEATGLAFVWAVKEAEENEEVKRWVGEFEKRNWNRGLIIKGWVPQVLILTHPAVGAFMTHCGWNSALEAVAAGVPMVTWPHFSDQFLNEKLVVEVLRTGVGVGVKMPAFHLTEVEQAVVGREKVEMVVRRVMCGGEEGEEMRKRAWELGEKARKAMEDGGSSYENLSSLIGYATGLAANRGVELQ